MKPLRHLHDLYNGKPGMDWHRDWPCILVLTGIVALSGPLVFLTFAIQNWCVASCWDYEDRWLGTKAFASAFLVVALLLVLLRGFFLQLWPPTLGALFWYPVFCWCQCLLLSPALALLMERVDPRTRPVERILLPAEVAQQQQAVEASERKATLSRSSQKKQAVAQTSEKGIASPTSQRRKTKRDPRPMYQAWADQQSVLPPAPRQGTTRPPGAAAGSKRDKRDEGESLADIF
jgi:hypothetical protein